MLFGIGSSIQYLAVQLFFFNTYLTTSESCHQAALTSLGSATRTKMLFSTVTHAWVGLRLSQGGAGVATKNLRTFHPTAER